MKKIAVILSAALLLGGCSSGGVGEISSENSETFQTTAAMTTAETAAVTTTSETTVTTATETTVTTVETTVLSETAADETTVTNPYMENENLLLGFISYLQKTEPPKGAYYVFDHGNSFDQYDFIDDFKIDGYSYQHRGDGSYNVKLICSDSTCDLFPNGESYWFFEPGRFCRYEEKDDVVTNYEFYEKYKDYPNYETISTAYNAACDFPFFEADEAWFREVRTDISHFAIHNFYHAYNPYLDKTQFADGGVYPDDLRTAIKKLYNITLSENAFDGFRFEEDGRIFVYCGHGGTWGYEALAGYEETESEVRVTVNFYGDEMYFYPVIQSEFTFSKNADGNITLQNVEKIFDRGYGLAIGTV